jgi:hypothetical protein
MNSACKKEPSVYILLLDPRECAILLGKFHFIQPVPILRVVGFFQQCEVDSLPRMSRVDKQPTSAISQDSAHPLLLREVLFLKHLIHALPQ